MAGIISGGVTFTFNDGDLEEIRSKVMSELDFSAMPGMTADAAMIFDFNGVSKTITINGVLTNTGNNTLSSGNAVTIDEQRQWLEKVLNGAQVGTTFTSNYSSTFNGSTFINSPVYFADVEFTERTDTPNALPFNINLYVGGL